MWDCNSGQLTNKSLLFPSPSLHGGPHYTGPVRGGFIWFWVCPQKHIIYCTHIGAHLDFLQNLCKSWWIHPIFTNFGDIFVEIFVDSLKFSLFLVIGLFPILPLFFSEYFFTNFGDFFREFFGESLKISLKLVIIFSQNFVPFFINFFSPIKVIFFVNVLVNHR